MGVIVKDRWPEPNDYVQPFTENDSLLYQRAILGLHLRNLVVAIEDELDPLTSLAPHVAALVLEAKVLLGWDDEVAATIWSTT